MARTDGTAGDFGLPMSRPQIFIIRMVLFLLLVVLVGVLLFTPLVQAFMGNLFINALILAVLLFGIAFCITRVMALWPEVSWVNAFRRGDPGLDVPRRTALLAPVAALLRDRDGPLVLTQNTSRAILDSIAARLDESRETTRYLGNLLIFLGILGTFWGLVQSVGSVKDVVDSLSVGGSSAEMAFEDLQSGLSGPLGGLATAVSSSLFGIAGSLIVSFLGLQAAQAQNRFYTDFEDWLSSITQIEPGYSAQPAQPIQAAASFGGADQVFAAIQASVDNVEALRDTIIRSEENRRQTEEWLIQTTQNLSEMDQVIRAQHDLLGGIATLAQDAAQSAQVNREENLALLRRLDASLQHLAAQGGAPSAPSADGSPAPAMSPDTAPTLLAIRDLTQRLLAATEARNSGEDIALLKAIHDAVSRQTVTAPAPPAQTGAAQTGAASGTAAGASDLAPIEQRLAQLVSLTQQSDERIGKALISMRDIAARQLQYTERGTDDQSLATLHQIADTASRLLMVTQSGSGAPAPASQPGAPATPPAPAPLPMDMSVFRVLSDRLGALTQKLETALAQRALAPAPTAPYPATGAQSSEEATAILRNIERTAERLLHSAEGSGESGNMRLVQAIGQHTQELVQHARGSADREILETLRAISQIAHSLRESSEEGRHDLVQELRSEMKILTKTIAALIIESRRGEAPRQRPEA